MNYQSPTLLGLARLVPCCTACGGGNRGDVVAAHSNQLRDGKGRGIKAHDYRVAFLCYRCHTELDQGAAMSREERVAFWEAAHRASIAWLFESGHLVVQAVAVPHVNPAAKSKPSKPIAKGRKLQGGGKFPPGRKLQSAPFRKAPPS